MVKKKEQRYKKDAQYSIPVPGVEYMVHGEDIQGVHTVHRICHEDNVLWFMVRGSQILYELSKHTFSLLKG